MLLYIIDGFNLVHKIPPVKRSSRPRQELITYINSNKLTGSPNNKVVIVFDGYPPDDFHSRGAFKIVFSGELSADEVIKTRLRSSGNKSEIVVVSDDREIRDAAGQAKARVCRAKDFIYRSQKTGTKSEEKTKDISYTTQKEITDEMRKIWLKE